MELKSSRVLKRGRADIDSSLKNLDPSEEKKISLCSGKSNSGKKRGSEVVSELCFDNANGDLEIEIPEGINDGILNTDDKGLFYGSEVLDPIKDFTVSSREGEIEETSVECVIAVVKSKRGRKRKIMESSERNGDGRVEKEKVEEDGVHVSRRVLRSRTMNFGGGVEVVDRPQLADRPKKKLKRRGRPPKVQRDEKAQLTVRPKKKLKRRGRPPKVLNDENAQLTMRLKKKLKRRGRPPKVQKDENAQWTVRPKKILKKRGRPLKLHIETNEILSVPVKSRGRPRKLPEKEMVSPGIKKNIQKDTMFKKLKRCVQPVKTEARTSATNVIKMGTVKLMAVKNNNNGVKSGLETLKIEKDDGEKEENIQGMEKRKGKQLVRDKIVDILLKAGWIIDRRSREGKAYKDCVYIEPSGRSHWSITRAYAKLKQKIEEDDADSNEISAYTPIPEEEMSLLFRFVDKELGYKKKKNRIRKILSKAAKIVTSKKKKKDSSKRKSSGKLKGDKTHHVNGLIDGRKPRLLARSSEKGSKQDNDGYLVYTGKRNLLSWMVDSGVISSGSKVQYGKTRQQKKSSEGLITSEGICCSCCNEIKGISEFVAHVGGKLNQTFDYIYLESGTSLRKCLMDSWRKEEESGTVRFNLVNDKGDDPNDDTCNICGDGGELVCCDGCPSTFHQSCLDIQNFPSGDWNCIYCSCKFCGVVSVNGLTSETLSCCLCEEKFHQLCLHKVEAVNADSGSTPFCGRKCQELFERLQTHLGVKLELEDGFSMTLLQRSDVGQDFTFHDSQSKVECNSKLAVAFSVMDECFVPIVDERSGTNIIHNVVYNCGSNFRRLNYAGFLTAILEKGDELVTAASIRIHGYQLAEMPFIGTRHMYRRQGMCRRLLDAIESTLSSIGVEELIIPAIPELLQTWTKVFGFIPIEESKREAMKCMSMVVFPGIDMLKKSLLQNRPSDANPSPSAASDDYEEKPSDAMDNEKPKEATILMDGCSCPKEDVTHLEIDKLSTSPGADSLCDLNFPVKNVICQVSETIDVLSSDAKSDIPAKCVPCESDVQISVVAFVESEQLPLGVENDDIHGVKASLLTSKLVPKNTFDLNLHPTAVDTDMQLNQRLVYDS